MDQPAADLPDIEDGSSSEETDLSEEDSEEEQNGWGGRALHLVNHTTGRRVIMTTLAVGLKAGLMGALDNRWLRLADSRDLVGLLLIVHCIQGLMTEGMKQWMITANRGWWDTMRVAADETAMVTQAIRVGQRLRKLKTIGSWQTHIAEEAAIDSWWLQLQGNSEGQQRRLKQWLLGMLVMAVDYLISKLLERHQNGK